MYTEKKAKSPKEYDEKALRHKAIELLARREYSYSELEKKLLLVSEDHETILRILDWLVEMELQNDERFTQMYLRSRALGGYGPVRIKLDLKQKGINEFLIENSFEELAFEWSEEVDRLIIKKVKDLSLEDMKLKNKVMGYLQRRGYTLNQIYSGFERFVPQV
ncbi:MAG: regulatory protein RecX [Bermanella sp.]